MKTLITISALTLLAGCASAPAYTPPRESWVNNPRAVRDYLEANVPAARLKRWKRALSDDKTIIQVDPETGSGTAY